MEMETVKYLQILTEEIHSVVVATLNEEGRPETRVIDSRCLSCGRCAEVCPVQAIHRPEK